MSFKASFIVHMTDLAYDQVGTYNFRYLHFRNKSRYLEGIGKYNISTYLMRMKTLVLIGFILVVTRYLFYCCHIPTFQ